MKKLIINELASVVEMSTFLRIVMALGLGCNRTSSGTLVIKDRPYMGDGVWAPLFNEEYKKITTMTVDHGKLHSCLYAETDPESSMKGMLDYSAPWMDLVDFADTLSLVVSTLNPEVQVSYAGTIGNRHQKEYLMEELLAELQKLQKQYNSQTDEEKAKESKLNKFFNGVELV